MDKINRVPTYRWIKLWCDNLNEPEYIGLSDASFGVYVKLYITAAKSDCAGILRSLTKVYTVRDLANILRSDETVLQSAITELEEAGLVTEINGALQIANFMSEQGPADNTERTKWADRQRRHRAEVVEATPTKPNKTHQPENVTAISQKYGKDLEQFQQQIQNRRQMEGLS